MLGGFRGEATRRHSGAESAPQAAGVDVQQREVQVKERNLLAAARRRQRRRHARDDSARRCTNRQRRRSDPTAGRRRADWCVVRRLRAQQVWEERVRRCCTARWRKGGTRKRAARSARARSLTCDFSPNLDGSCGDASASKPLPECEPASKSACSAAPGLSSLPAPPPPLPLAISGALALAFSACARAAASALCVGDAAGRVARAWPQGASGHAPLEVCSPRRPPGSRPPAPRPQPLPPPRRPFAAASAAQPVPKRPRAGVRHMSGT